MENTRKPLDHDRVREMLASEDQSTRIAAFRMLCMEKFEASEELFKTRIEPNIEKYRKGDCRLRLTDEKGNPLKNQKVKINQTGHDFKYGANIFLLDEFPTEEENQKYRDFFHQYFNLATVPFYWAELEPEQDKPRYAADSYKIHRRPAPDLCVEYCKEKGILPKLHCLFYDKFIPAWLPKKDAAEMKRLYEKRFAEIAERYTGDMYEFEVSNEMLDEWKWDAQSVLCSEKEILPWVYDLARKYFPNEKLVINESNRTPEIGEQDYRSPYFMMIENLLLKGASIDKIGIQNHIFCSTRYKQEDVIWNYLQYFDPEKLLKGLGCLAEFGKPLEITEITIPTFGEGEEAEQLQADLLNRLYHVWFSIPAMETLVYWNTVEGMAYRRPDGASDENRVRGGIFRRDLTPKKAALELKRLFTEEWHTAEELTTDENGFVSFRGFYGDYTADVDGKALTFGLHKNESVEQNLIV